MNRRNVLIGLGGLVAGGGALLGTGAFTTVEAQRTVSVQTAGDADAFLGLTPADGDDNEGYVTVNNDLIEINFDADAGENAGDGLNQRARTTFLELVTVTNQGTQNVDEISLDLQPDDESDVTGVFSYPVDGDDDNDVENGSDILSEADNGPTLEPGQDVTFGIIVDLLENGANLEDLTAENYTLTITAEAAE